MRAWGRGIRFPLEWDGDGLDIVDVYDQSTEILEERQGRWGRQLRGKYRNEKGFVIPIGFDDLFDFLHVKLGGHGFHGVPLSHAFFPSGDGPSSLICWVNSLMIVANLVPSEPDIHSSLNRSGESPTNPMSSFITATRLAVM